MTQLTGVKITVNYPDEKEVEAAVPETMTPMELSRAILELCRTEPEMTSFVVVGVVKK